MRRGLWKRSWKPWIHPEAAIRGVKVWVEGPLYLCLQTLPFHKITKSLKRKRKEIGSLSSNLPGPSWQGWGACPGCSKAKRGVAFLLKTYIFVYYLFKSVHLSLHLSFSVVVWVSDFSVTDELSTKTPWQQALGSELSQILCLSFLNPEFLVIIVCAHF